MLNYRAVGGGVVAGRKTPQGGADTLADGGMKIITWAGFLIYAVIQARGLAFTPLRCLIHCTIIPWT